MVPDFFMFDLLNASWGNVGDLPVVSISETPFYGVDGVVKRVEDIVIAGAILLLVAIPMIAIAIGVKLSSPGPIIFRQHRYGLRGNKIEVWKFRTMRALENGTTVIQAQKDDPRVTPFGALLRRTSLDELPQLINVLQGRMSLVGPRPHAVVHNEQYRKLIDRYMLRHKVKPGITGWAQINGWRGETDTLDKMQKRVEYDLAYIHNWSLWLDLKIIFLTVFRVLRDKQAY
jgi:putative colanic acid biosynthesis UDP-glucose lipid carrier transferase